MRETTNLRFSKNKIKMVLIFFSCMFRTSTGSFGLIPFSKLLKIPLNKVILTMDRSIIKSILISTQYVQDYNY